MEKLISNSNSYISGEISQNHGVSPIKLSTKYQTKKQKRLDAAKNLAKSGVDSLGNL